MLSFLGSVLVTSNISLQNKFLLLPFCRGGLTAQLHLLCSRVKLASLVLLLCIKLEQVEWVFGGLGWLPHSSRVENNKSYTHAFSAFELKLHEWMGLESEILRLKWHVGCYCSLPHTNTNFRLLCLNVMFRATAPGLGIILAIAPTPKVSNWHCAKIWVCALRLLVWSSWSNSDWWAYWCQSSSSPVWDLSYQASAWSELSKKFHKSLD